MLRYALSLCVLTAATLGLFAAGVTADEDAGMVRKTFDLSAITTPVRAQKGPTLGARMWQYVYRPSRKAPKAVTRPFLTGDYIVDLLRTWVHPEAWEQQGAWIEFRGAQLVVRNRPEVVRHLEGALYELAAAASQRVLLHVEVREADDSTGGCSISGSIELPIGMPKSLAVTSRVDYVADYEVEIAQASNISNPLDLHLDEGLVVDAIAHPLLDGKRVLLEAHLQFCCLEEMRAVELGIDEECFNQPFRSPERSTMGRVQLPGCSHADLHVSMVVADGDDVLIPVISGERKATLRFHVDLLDPIQPRRLVGVSALTTPAFQLHAGEPPESEERESYHKCMRLHPRDGEGRGPLGSIDEVVELVHTGVATARWEEGEERLDALPSQSLAVTARNDLLAEVRTFLAAREAEALRPVELDVAVLSVRDAVTPGPGHDLDPELTTVVASGRLHTLSGRWAAIRLGTTRNYVADYDAEVAQEARIPDPVVGQTFGGLVANVRPHLPLAGRTVRVDLDLIFSVDELATESFDSGVQYLGPIEQVRARRTRLDTSIGVPLGGRTLIDAGPDPDNAGARLVVTVSVRTP